MVDHKGHPPPPPTRVERYRFRVRGPDGRVLTSGLAELVLPAPLTRPQWSHAELAPGEAAHLSVAAPGRDGESVLFLVERLHGGAWEPVNHASAKVEKGESRVTLPMPALPAAAELSHRLRFRAVAADRSELCSEEALLSAVAPVGGRLLFAGFAHARYREGGTASLLVEAQGLDGTELRLHLERSDGVPGGEARAVLQGGQARASVPIARGQARAAGAPPPQMRLRVACAAGDLVSAAVELDPPLSEGLRFPEWAGAVPGRGSAFAHGETALMRVQAPGLDGHTVRFVVEQLHGARWEPYTTATATVHEGAACAELRALHPERSGRGAPLLPLRFRPELVVPERT